MPHPIINIDALDLKERPRPGPSARDGDRYAVRIGQIGREIGAQKLGYNLTVVPAGKCAFPLHNHRVNEEMFFVLSGAGELRVGAARHPIRAGDVIACPPGGPETAHQIVNSSATEELRYLAVSTIESPELVDYPDSGKFGIYAAMTFDRPGERTFRFIGRVEESRDYWEGE
ncbi:MAG: cupin domain-containing protein [Alphaproteobacteria bacterium]